MKQQFIKNNGNTLKTYIYEHNRALKPASASITIYMPGSDLKLVDNAAMAISLDGLLSYELSASENSIAGINYKAVISYVIDNKAHHINLFYDVVNSILVKVVTDEDIMNELPQLKDNGWKAHGIAQSGTATAMIDPSLVRYEDDYFTGGLAYSAQLDETRPITSFASSTGTVGTEAFSGPFSGRYILTRSYTKEIQRAFEKIEEKLIRLGKRPHLILDPYDLREAHINMSVAEVCKGLTANENDLWWGLWKEYEKKAEEIFSSLVFKYDSNSDGYISGKEKNAEFKVLQANRR